MIHQWLDVGLGIEFLGTNWWGSQSLSLRSLSILELTNVWDWHCYTHHVHQGPRHRHRHQYVYVFYVLLYVLYVSTWWHEDRTQELQGIRHTKQVQSLRILLYFFAIIKLVPKNSEDAGLMIRIITRQLEDFT